MTLLQLSAPPQNPRFVDAEDFVQRLIGRSQLERDDDVEHGEFGLRDPLTGERVHIPMIELNRYAAGMKDRVSLLRAIRD